MTVTPSIFSIPSISVSIWLSTRSVTFVPTSCPRVPASASISSKKMIQGATCRALLKTRRTPSSDSPTHFERSSGPRTAMKLASLSVATPLASSVFPQPGGPCSKIPRGASIPILLKACGFFRGNSTASLSSCFTCSSPPMSSHFTSGTSTNASLMAEGSTSRYACMKSSIMTVRWSRISWEIPTSSPWILGITLLMVFMAASLQRAAMSAPTYPWVMPAILSRSTSLPRDIPRVCIKSISFLPSVSGTPISISLSNRPGLLRAGSIAFGIFVAAMTTTFPLDFNPSIRVSNWETTRLSTSPVTFSLLGAIASISSIKMMAGAFFSASSKTFLRFSSDWP